MSDRSRERSAVSTRHARARVRRAPCCTVVVATLAFLGLAAPAVASDGQEAAAQQGVAVDVGRIDVDQSLRPGETYSLPSIGVRNPGTQPTTYVMGVQAVAGDRLATPEDWLAFAPSGFALAADERLRVEVTLTIPRGAEAGEYEALIAAQVAGTGEGARVGAAAASRLTFTVDEEAAPRHLPWWVWLVGSAILGVAALRRLAGRYRIELVRQR